MTSAFWGGGRGEEEKGRRRGGGNDGIIPNALIWTVVCLCVGSYIYNFSWQGIYDRVKCQKCGYGP